MEKSPSVERLADRFDRENWFISVSVRVNPCQFPVDMNAPPGWHSPSSSFLSGAIDWSFAHVCPGERLSHSCIRPGWKERQPVDEPFNIYLCDCVPRGRRGEAVEERNTRADPSTGDVSSRARGVNA